MPSQGEMFAPADLATLEARGRAQAERIRRRYQLEPRPPRRPDCPESVARAHLDTIHRILGEEQPAEATPERSFPCP